jgi:sulfur carrier protein
MTYGGPVVGYPPPVITRCTEVNRIDMDIQINQKPLTLPEGATVADALAAFGARPPYAVALNGDFVARTQHGARALSAGDRLDVVSPVAGG